MEEGLDRSYTHPLAIAPNRKGLLFTAAAATPPPGWQPSARAAIYRSEDSGKSWAQLTEGLPAEFDEMVHPLATDEAGTVFAAAGTFADLVEQYADVSPVVETKTVSTEKGEHIYAQYAWGQRSRKPKWTSE